MQVLEPLVLGSGVEALSVPEQDQDPEVLVHCTVAGWGSTQVRFAGHFAMLCSPQETYMWRISAPRMKGPYRMGREVCMV